MDRSIAVSVVVWVCTIAAVAGAEEADLDATIAKLGVDHTYHDFDRLREFDRVRTVQKLAAELKPVAVEKILSWEQETHPKEMHIVWCIRALRCLTGLKMTAPTAHRFTEAEDVRDQFLHKEREDEVTFFSVWMSRESTYFAPDDAQRAIIRKWKRWAEEEALDFDFPPPVESFNEWYF